MIPGGWQNPETKELFHAFALDAIEQLQEDVDFWITFNEPTVYGLLTYVSGLWPDGNGQAGGVISMLNFGIWRGAYSRALGEMAEAHRRVYQEAKRRWPGAQIGFAHHVSYLVNQSGQRSLLTWLADQLWTWSFPDAIRDQLDFVGVNYYGAEHIRPFSQDLLPEVEYSEAGRAISPRGFYEVLKAIHARYPLPIYVTENGVADATDWIRPAYLTEHLAALHQAMSDGVDVRAYVFWTISDNWEWADGYCPKFGLVAVDRSHPDLKRSLRPSFDLFRAIASTRTLTCSQRSASWDLLRANVGKMRPFCRAADGVSALDQPSERAIRDLDWRFESRTTKLPK